MQADQIYQLVKTAFSELGATEPICRTILLREGYFVGHRYRCGDFQADWLAENDMVEITDAEGKLLTTINLHEQVKRAA